MAAETKFTGTDTYVASDDLLAAVEVATKLQKPLLVKGDREQVKLCLLRQLLKLLTKNY